MSFWRKSEWLDQAERLPLDHAELHASEPRQGRQVSTGSFNGGTAYFVAKSGDLSTLFEDLALIAAHRIVLRARIWDACSQVPSESTAAWWTAPIERR